MGQVTVWWLGLSSGSQSGERGLISKAGAGLVTVAVGVVVGVGSAICCCCWPVAEARGRQDANDVGGAVSGVVEVRWVCCQCWTLKGKALHHISTSRVCMKNGRNVVGWVR